MIDSKTEYIYNILLSVFFGIVIVLIFDQLFDKPRIIDIYEKENKDGKENKDVYKYVDNDDFLVVKNDDFAKIL
jgi:hypothetical protein